MEYLPVINICFYIPAMLCVSLPLAGAQESRRGEPFDDAVKFLRPEIVFEDSEGQCRLLLKCNNRTISLGELLPLELYFEGHSRQFGLNPFETHELPQCLIISIFGEDGQLIGTFPAPEPPEARTKSLLTAFENNTEANSLYIHDSERKGIRMILTSGALSAMYRNTIIVDRAGKYTLQAICSRAVFAHHSKEPPKHPMQRAEWDRFNLQLIHPRYYNAEACRSAPLEIVVEEGRAIPATTTPVTFTPQTAPVKARLEFVRYTDEGELEIRMRMDNLSREPIWLYQPVMSEGARTKQPLKFPLWDEHGTVVHNYADLWTISFTGVTPSSFVNLPPDGFVSVVHTIPKRWASSVRSMQAIYTEDLFATEEFVYAVSQQLQGKMSRADFKAAQEKNERERPRHNVESNILRVVPSDQLK